jgi:hypothetical protein
MSTTDEDAETSADRSAAVRAFYESHLYPAPRYCIGGYVPRYAGAGGRKAFCRTPCMTFENTSSNCADALIGVMTVMADKMAATARQPGVQKATMRAASLSSLKALSRRIFFMTAPGIRGGI